MPKKQREYQGSLFWGVVLVLLGVIFLLQTMFDIRIWGFIWQFWPLALVAVGIYLIAKRNERS